MLRELVLASRDKTPRNRTILADQEQRRTRDVPGIHSNPVPDAVRAQRVARAVDQDRERQPVLAQPVANGIGSLRENRGRADVALEVFTAVTREGAKLAPAVWSPGAAMEREQESAATEEVLQRMNVPVGVR